MQKVLLVISLVFLAAFGGVVSAVPIFIHSINLASPDVIGTFGSGSYSNPQPGVGQISALEEGSAVAAWSLAGIDFTNAKRVKLSFEMLTDATSRVTTLFGFSTSSSFACCLPDRNPVFSQNAKVTFVQNDLGGAGSRVFFASRVFVDPTNPDSGQRVLKVFDAEFPGFTDDAIFHNYTLEMRLDSQMTLWIGDGGAIQASHVGFTFVPTNIVFWAQGHEAAMKIAPKEIST